MIISVKKLGARKPVVANGNVTIPIQEYNEMLKKVAAYENAVMVTYDHNTWRGQSDHEIRLEFKVEPFKEVILDKLMELPQETILRFDGEMMNFDRICGFTTLASKREEIKVEEE